VLDIPFIDEGYGGETSLYDQYEPGEVLKNGF